MRIAVSHNKRRESFEVESTDTIGSVKERVLDAFQIDTRSGGGDRKYVVLSYQGADLDDKWVLGDIGIQAGVTLRCGFREEVTPKLYAYCAYNDETVEILEDINLSKHTVANLRTMITRRTGLPVTTFRVTTQEKKEMYDDNILEKYDIELQDTVRVETWDGWNEFLKAAMIGQTAQVIYHMNQEEGINKFQARVALFIAAHHGHMDLASSMLKYGIRSDEPVGDHPIREWCRSSHVDAYKTPVHEAAEHGQLSILRIFVFTNICCVTCKDGNGLTGLNVALRKQQREVALYLLTKQWSNVQFSAVSLPLTIYSQIRKWCDRAKEKVLLIYGASRSSMKEKKVSRKAGARAGQDVHVDGYTDSMMNSNPKSRFAENRGRSLSTPDFRLPRISGRRTPALVTKYRTRYYSKYHGEDELLHPDLPDVRPRSQSLFQATTLPQISNRRTTLAVTNQKKGSRDLTALLSDGGESINDTNGKSNTSAYIRTAGTGRNVPREKDNAPIDHKTLVSFTKSAESMLRGEKERIRRNRAASMESAISLPAVSADHSPGRPFFHANSIADNVPRRTVHAYEKLSGQTTWERAIDSLTIASAFKDKPWLHQVKLAMDFSKNNVRKMTTKTHRSNLHKRKSKTIAVES
ncbi:Protein ANKUB1 [Holothuria leucospilota]|uniref:Protein ANKUB1 n=1 Tax=Holothuria leucospilota TaxID=206669 RepID=A0A9Q1CE37_HOLLE|nr:Protein ANKUB1 [Holothuria leucospilota]